MATVHEQHESKTFSVHQGQEIVVRRKNDVGVLFELSSLVADQGVNILALSGSVWGDEGLLRLLTDDLGKTKDVLAKNGFTCEEESVLLVELPHRPGMLKEVTKTLAQEGLDIRHIYAAATREQDRCLLILHSSNDPEALARLESRTFG